MNPLIIIFLAFAALTPLSAVQTGSGYQTSQPTNGQVPNWTTGWPGSGITGWNYVGQVNGASGTYLGYGWVLTAGHVGTWPFVLNGVTYQPISGSSHFFTNTDGSTADLDLFQISPTPSLPALAIRTTAPVALSQFQNGSNVALIGYGGGQGESWGYNMVDFIDQVVQPTGYNLFSNDFLTLLGTYTVGSRSSTNNSNLVGEDSGGGDFMYNSSTRAWELAGINEVTGTATIGANTYPISGFVQLNTYAAQINAVINASITTDTPTLPLPGLLALCVLLLFAAYGSLRGKSSHQQS